MFQLRLQTESNHVAELEELFFACGAVSVSTEDAADSPIFEPSVGEHPIWPQTYMHAFFISSEQAELASKAVANTQYSQQAVIAEEIEAEDWQSKFQQNFSARQYGQRLWIYPSWTENPDPDGLSIQLDPGLAFGTGQHPTTELCLEWLSQADLNNKVIIDFGSGSGILSLAAHKLGATHIYAIDIDPQAQLATTNNIKHNQLELNAFSIGDISILNTIKVDLIVANILAGPLQELRDIFSQHLNSSGELVLSGILNSQAETLVNHYESAYQCQARYVKEDWSCIHFRPNL